MRMMRFCYILCVLVFGLLLAPCRVVAGELAADDLWCRDFLGYERSVTPLGILPDGNDNNCSATRDRAQ